MACKRSNCAICQFWQQVPDEDGHLLGLCRRFPPSYEGWPMTRDAEWCGEFLPTAQSSAPETGIGS